MGGKRNPEEALEMAVIVAMGMEGHCVKVAVTPPGRVLPLTINVLPPRIVKVSSQCLGHWVRGFPWGPTTQVWSPSNL